MVEIRGVGSSPLQPSRAERSSGSSAAAAAKKPAPGELPAGETGDSIEISSSAKEAQVISHLVETAQSSQDVRIDAVVQARETLARGGFDGREAAHQAANRIADELLGP